MSLGGPRPSHTNLLIEAAVDGAPADLHEPLGGDEHLVDPFPWEKPSQAQQVNEDGLCHQAWALEPPRTRWAAAEHGLTFVHARGRADSTKVAVSDHLGGEQGWKTSSRAHRGPHSPLSSPWRCVPVTANATHAWTGREGLGLCQQGLWVRSMMGRGSWLCWEELGAEVPPRGFQGYVRRVWGLRTQWATLAGVCGCDSSRKVDARAT